MQLRLNVNNKEFKELATNDPEEKLKLQLI